MRKTFDKKFVISLLENEYDGDDAEVVVDNIVETTRWSEVHELIFEYEGKMWQTIYSCGLTEYQDESPFEYEDFVECTEVEPYQKTIVAYRPVR